MPWLQQSFQENTIVWLLISSVLGGIIGASVHFLFDFLLPQQAQQRREVISVKRKYATPVLLAAAELRGRLGNMIRFIERVQREQWLNPDAPSGYYYASTLYVVGKFFGWLQILRRTIIYIDFTSVKETRQFENFLKAIEDGFTDPDLLAPSVTGLPEQTADKWIYTYWMQAMGELMIIRDGDDYRTLDYATFYKNYKQSDNADFRNWFSQMEQLFAKLTADEPRFKRIVATHAFLNAFVNFIDPKHLRTRQRPDHLSLLSTEEAKRIESRIEHIVADKQNA
jgi:hypothetical protein